MKLQRIFFGGMPPSSGKAMWSVELGAMPYSRSVVEGEVRCLPAWTRRREDGGERLVRRARRERSVLMEVFGGSVRGIAGGV